MKMLESILSQLSSDEILADLTSLLREQDPEFPPMEAAFLEAAEALVSDLGAEKAQELLNARNQQIISDMTYAAFQGFQANLFHFREPVASQFTRLDDSVFLREYIMQTLPRRVKAERTITAFREHRQEPTGDCEDPISSYYIYLEVTGPKLAHYWGYLFANRFLPWVEPGYVSDGAQTSIYAMELHRSLGFWVKKM